MNLLNTITAQLRKFDLNDKEIHVYLTSLEHGVLTLQNLAEKCGFKRSTTYGYVDVLIEAGFLRQTKIGTKRGVVAEPPEKLEKILEGKKWQVTQMEADLPGTIDQIRKYVPGIQLPQMNQESTDMTYYEGIEQVRRVYDDSLSAKEIWSYVNVEAVLSIFPENEDKYQAAMKKGMQLREIVDYGTIENAKKGMDEYIRKSKEQDTIKNYKYKLIPKSTELSTIDYMIYDGKIAIISLGEKPTGIIIKNKNLFDYSKTIFDIVWASLPDEL